MFILELVGTVLGFLCVALLIFRNHWSWPVGFAQVISTMLVFWESKLYAEAGLQIVFAVLQLVGWWAWLTSKSAGRSMEVAATPIRVESLSSAGLIASMISTAGLTVALAWILVAFTDGRAPWIDAFITAASLTAQVLLAARYHENWGYWIVVDMVSIPLYMQRELYAFAVLYGLFLLLAMGGWWSWLQALRSQATESRMEKV
jgi:nicotinamide mononucleotide transporter